MSKELDPKGPGSDADAADSGEMATPFVVSLPDQQSSGKDWYLWAGVLAILVLVAFWPAISGTFIWDDDHHVTQNPALQNLEGLKHIWVAPIATVQYYPLTHTMFWLEWRLWGLNPMGYHIINLLLHAGSAVLIWRILRRLGLPGAWLAAAIWAVHPLQAESVSWISERKNVLSGLLFFAAAWYYIEFAGLAEGDENRPTFKLSNPWLAYALSFWLFVAALLAKTVACSLAPALLIVLWWKRRLNKQNVLGLVPFFIIGLALAWVTVRMESSPGGAVGASGPEWDLTLAEKLLVAGRGFWFYIAKLLVPIHLSFNYARIAPNPADVRQWGLVMAAVAVVVMLAALCRKLGRGPLAAVLFYIAVLFPSLGFFRVFPFRYSFVADHFQYLASLGVIVLIIAAIAQLFPAEKATEAGVDVSGQPAALPPAQSLAAVLAAVLAIVLAGASWIRASDFVDMAGLWKDTLNKNPNSWLAAYNLGIERTSQITIDVAAAQEATQQGEKDQADTSLKDAEGQADEATSLFNRVLKIDNVPPTFRYLSYNGLGTVELRRAAVPGADVLACLERAGRYLTQSIEMERVQHASSPDATPYLNRGVVDLQWAEYLERRLPSLSTTRPSGSTTRTSTTMPARGNLAASAEPSPTTRPATVSEQEVIDKALSSADYFLQAITSAHEALAKPAFSHLRATKDLALALFSHGESEFKLASLAQRRHDETESARRNRAAQTDYLQSLQINSHNVAACYQLAACYEWFDDLDRALFFNKQAILESPGYRNPAAYNAAGHVLAMKARRMGSMSELQTAIACFKTALDEQPEFPDAKMNLRDAIMLMNSATRPSTRATTGPASEPMDGTSTRPLP